MGKQEFIDYLGDTFIEDKLDVFLNFNGSVADFFLKHPEGGKFYWWCWDYRQLPGEFTTSELINTIALANPWYALKYCSDKLNPQNLKDCSLIDPWGALSYASDKFDEEFLEKLRGLV